MKNRKPPNLRTVPFYLKRDGPSEVDHLEAVEEGHGVRGHVIGDLPHSHHTAGRGIGGQPKGLLIDHGL